MDTNNNWSQSVTGILIKDGKVLLARHTYGSGAGKLIVPGGYVQIDEMPEEAVKREFLEETKVVVEPKEIIGIRFNTHDWYVAFLVDYVSGEATSDNCENSEVIWVDVNEALERDDVPDLTKKLLRCAMEKSKGLQSIPYNSQKDRKGTLYGITKMEDKMKDTKFDSLILDVDGTLWDSTGVVANAWMKAVNDYDGNEVTITSDMLKKLFGKVMTEIAANLFPEYDDEKRDVILKNCCEYEHRFLEENETDICYEGVVSTIKEISEKIPLFIVSNCQSGYIELFLEKTGLNSYVKDIECFGNTGKMKGDNILLLMERNNLKNPAYVGDITGDFEAAKYAGIPFVHASYGFGQVENPDYSISKFADLKEFV